MKRKRKTRFRKRNPPPGSQPGTLAISGQGGQPVIGAFEYGPDGCSEHLVTDLGVLRGYLSGGRKLWVDVQGLGSERVLRAMADVFQIHPLAIADVANVPQRPKVEPYAEHVFVVTRVVIPEGPGRVHTSQIAMFVGRNYVLTFQEKPGATLDPVRERLSEGQGPIRTAGPDYLAYVVWDTIIDGYYPILEQFGEYLEGLEDKVVTRARQEELRDLHDTRHELMEIRRAIWPQRDAINSLIRDKSPFISDDARVYFRDCYDHCVQIVDVIETYREVAGGLMEVYLSSLSMRQSEIMKTLTLVATIFIPLTFLVGVYGMNFDNMPELHWRWSYLALWLVMLGTAGTMLVCFRRRGWLGTKSRRGDKSTLMRTPGDERAPESRA